MKSIKLKYMMIIFLVLSTLFYLRLKQVEISVQTFNAMDLTEIEVVTEAISNEQVHDMIEMTSEYTENLTQETRQVYSVGLDETFTLDAFNQLDIESLMSFKGIGLVTAQAIIEDRIKNGPIQTFDDLKRIKGIGDKKLANILYELP